MARNIIPYNDLSDRDQLDVKRFAKKLLDWKWDLQAIAEEIRIVKYCSVHFDTISGWKLKGVLDKLPEEQSSATITSDNLEDSINDLKDKFLLRIGQGTAQERLMRVGEERFFAMAAMGDYVDTLIAKRLRSGNWNVPEIDCLGRLSKTFNLPVSEYLRLGDYVKQDDNGPETDPLDAKIAGLELK